MTLKDSILFTENIFSFNFLVTTWQSIFTTGAVGVGLYLLLKPSKKHSGLDDIPTVSTASYIWALITGATQDEQNKTIWQKKFEKNGMAKLQLFGRTIIYIANPDIIRFHNSHNDIFQKQPRQKKYPLSYFTRVFGTNVVTSNGEAWKRQRRVANPAFHNIDVQVFNEVAEILIQVIARSNQKGSVKALSLMQRTTLDILGKALFCYDFNSLQEPNGHLVQVYHNVMAELINPIIILLPKWDHLFRSQKAWRDLKEYEDLLDGIIKQKNKTGITESDKDLLSRMMIANQDPENQRLTDEELRSNMIAFMIAGHDTTANSLTYILYYMAIHKDVQTRAREEVVNAFGSEPGYVAIGAQKNLDYLTACIKETLRLCPPIPQGFTRETTKDITLDNGITIPKGVAIVQKLYSMQHNRQYWPDPESFNPERFFDPAIQHSAAWSPFSSGPRACIGMNFSLIEQRIILSYLLRAFEWDLAPETVHQDGLKFSSVGFLALSPKEILINFRPII